MLSNGVKQALDYKLLGTNAKKFKNKPQKYQANTLPKQSPILLKAMVPILGMTLPPRGHRAWSQTFLVVTTGGDTTGI